MGEKYVIAEVSSNAQWELLTGQSINHVNSKDVKLKSEFKNLTPIKPNQLMLIDIFTGWSGPCIAIGKTKYQFKISSLGGACL